MAVHPNSLKNLRPFKKGNRANPGGRPKGSGVVNHLRRLGMEQGGTADGKPISNNEVIARGIIIAATHKDDPHYIEAVRIYLDRTDGKALERVVQHIDISAGAIVPKAIIPTPEKETKVE